MSRSAKTKVLLSRLSRSSKTKIKSIGLSCRSGSVLSRSTPTEIKVIGLSCGSLGSRSLLSESRSTKAEALSLRVGRSSTNSSSRGRSTKSKVKGIGLSLSGRGRSSTGCNSKAKIKSIRLSGLRSRSWLRDRSTTEERIARVRTEQIIGSIIGCGSGGLRSRDLRS